VGASAGEAIGCEEDSVQAFSSKQSRIKTGANNRIK
jgi:hypothetical protein